MHYSVGVHARLTEEFKRARKWSTWRVLRQWHVKNLDKDVKRQWSYNQGNRGLQWLNYRNGQLNEAGYQSGWQDISACLWGLGANLHLPKASILSHRDRIRTSMPVRYTRDWRSEVLSSQCLAERCLPARWSVNSMMDRISHSVSSWVVSRQNVRAQQITDKGGVVLPVLATIPILFFLCPF